MVLGKLVCVVGLMLEVIGCKVFVGSLCKVEIMNGEMEVEVVGFFGDNFFLMFSEQIIGVFFGVKVIFIMIELGLFVGMELLGCVIDGVGNLFDGLGLIYID